MIKVNFKRRQMVQYHNEVIALFVFANKIIIDKEITFPSIINDDLYICTLSNVKSIECVKPTDL